METSAAKDFGAIESDYDFFMASSNEAERDLAAFRPRVERFAARGGPTRMLDLGCGAGDFTETFLDQAGWPPDRLSLSLVEPVESQRERAARRLERFTRVPIVQWPIMPDTPVGPFDLVLTNHVLYYVTDLDETIDRVVASLAPGGEWLIAMGGKTSELIMFWNLACKLTGQSIPYHMSEDLGAALERRGIAYDREDVVYDLGFADSRANRMKMLRFLLADHLADVPNQPLLDLFDPWSDGGRIAAKVSHQHYTVHGS